MCQGYRWFADSSLSQSVPSQPQPQLSDILYCVRGTLYLLMIFYMLHKIDCSIILRQLRVFLCIFFVILVSLIIRDTNITKNRTNNTRKWCIIIIDLHYFLLTDYSWRFSWEKYVVHEKISVWLTKEKVKSSQSCATPISSKTSYNTLIQTVSLTNFPWKKAGRSYFEIHTVWCTSCAIKIDYASS